MTDRRISDKQAATIQKDADTSLAMDHWLPPRAFFYLVLDALHDRASDIAEIARLRDQLKITISEYDELIDIGREQERGACAAEIAQLKQAVESATSLAENKTAPVQDFPPQRIPWSLHLKAYEAYAKRYGTRQSAERLAERGGFDTSEMDMFAPGWRDEVDEIIRLRKERDDAASLAAKATERVAELEKGLETIAAWKRDKCEIADAETLFMLLDNKIDCARAVLGTKET
jgi:hypothetical protein